MDWLTGTLAVASVTLVTSFYGYLYFNKYKLTGRIYQFLYSKNTPYFCHTIKSNCYGLVQCVAHRLLCCCSALVLCYG